MKKSICKKISLTDYYTSQAKAIAVTTILILVWNGIAWIVNSIKNNNYMDIEGENDHGSI